jgi:two-component system chemotaxis response regulator CheB
VNPLQSGRQPLRVLIVDDSVFNRRSLAEIFSANPAIEVVGKAADGEEALRLVNALRPDAITLDLEMPRMDGFTFLRILMSKLPTPVVVVSSYSQKDNVFKALELGAFDFVAKPDRLGDPDLAGIARELMQKVLLAGSVRLSPPKVAALPVESVRGKPELGPATSPHYGVVIAQHMPDKFTRTFAERLDRRSELAVSEAQDRDVVGAGTGFVCPGRHCMDLETDVRGVLRLRVGQPTEQDRYIPSADRLLTSVARVAGPRAVGVILTGMGDDGVLGAQAILSGGGMVIAESELTAVVYGMPGSAVRAGAVTQVLPLPEIAGYLARL